MPEKEIKFSEAEITEKQEEAQEMDKKAEEMVEKGEAKTPQEAVERIEEQELRKLIESKAEYVYDKNIVVRFTNTAFLDDIFTTKAEFKGWAMLIMDNDDYERYYEDRNYQYLPSRKATLSRLVDEVYRHSDHPDDPKQCSQREKHYTWDYWIGDRTDWMGTGVRHYEEDLQMIREIKRESSNRLDFATKIRECVIKRFNLNPEKPPQNEVLADILKDKEYFQKPGKLREYLHTCDAMSFRKREQDKKELKSKRDIARNYNIGMLVSLGAMAYFGSYGRKSWGLFKDSEEIDIKKDLKGIICTIRDRVFEKKVIEEMLELTTSNPEARVPVFDLDGNQIWPTRKKRQEIEETVRQKHEAEGEKDV